MEAQQNGGPAEVAVPEPVPPVYTQLKDLHLRTQLVAGGEPRITIIRPSSGIYDALVACIQRIIADITGVTVPIAADDSPAGVVPIEGNLVALGNRSTNKTVEELYNRYYCILDLKYPGPGGYNVRTLHNPFGDGSNVIFVGGSDLAGVKAATEAFVGLLGRAGGKAGELSVGWLMEIKLGEGTRIEGIKRWEDANRDLYGWNAVSEQMAMYYMTGEERYTREMIRYALYPDEQVREEVSRRHAKVFQDGILAESDHYSLHFMNLFWDLIEESPAFTNEERLEVTNALARQLLARGKEGCYYRSTRWRKVEHEDMHSTHSYLCLYVLGRYFAKDYADPIWDQCLRAAHLFYKSLHEDAQFAAGVDNLFWYCNEVQPILTYMLLTGWREPLESGALQNVLRGQEALISGLPGEWALRCAPLVYPNKVAYLLQDGGWLTYRDRLNLDTDVFRIGQSFWPEEHLKPSPPIDLVNAWNIYQMPEHHRLERETGFAPGEAFYFGSVRSAPDASGDFILIDGYNGEGRNPYHAFAVSELRLDGRTLLQGYRNQVLVSADGLMEPRLAMDAALKHAEVVADTAVVAAEVPQMSWSTWRRSLVQRVGQYALFVDEVTFREASDNMTVEILWETTGDKWSAEQEALELTPDGSDVVFEVRAADPLEYRQESVSRLGWHGPAKAGDRQLLFSLLAKRAKDRPLACLRVAGNAAALTLPEAALAVVGSYQQTSGELVVLAENHLFGLSLTSAGLGEQLLTASRPVEVMWDFASGLLAVVAGEPVALSVAVEGQPDAKRFELVAGRHRLEGLTLTGEASQLLRDGLRDELERGKEERTRAIATTAAARQVSLSASALRAVFTSELGTDANQSEGAVVYSGADHVRTETATKVVDLEVASVNGDLVICAAAGKEVQRVRLDGTQLPPLEADDDIRVMRWWPEYRLLLVGCVDEEVIAFDEEGNRRWVFVSDKSEASYTGGDDFPSVWNSYWPGTEGIHGLHTGVFLDNKTQAFVGSTNTFEILDQHGKLLKKLVILRGMVHKFALLNRDDHIELLMARSPSDWDALTVLDNEKLQLQIEGFHEAPPGHKVIWAWMQMRPVFLSVQDMDSDGTLEVVAVIDGVWNRVGVWKADQTPLAAANFPPGQGGQVYRNLPGADVVDLDGDTKMEIVVATAGGTLVALDHQCRRIWSRRLPAAPTVLKAVPAAGDDPPWVLVGCANGSLLGFDGDGQVIAQGKLEGRPVQAELVELGEAQPMVVVGTDQGHLAGFTR